jgi:hypothetical protein
MEEENKAIGRPRTEILSGGNPCPVGEASINIPVEQSLWIRDGSDR